MKAGCRIKNTMAEGNRQKKWLASKAGRKVSYKCSKELAVGNNKENKQNIRKI